jgi:hypothetical protein
LPSNRRAERAFIRITSRDNLTMGHGQQPAAGPNHQPEGRLVAAALGTRLASSSTGVALAIEGDYHGEGSTAFCLFSVKNWQRLQPELPMACPRGPADRLAG